jgi:serine/threonine protein kinase
VEIKILSLSVIWSSTTKTGIIPYSMAIESGTKLGPYEILSPLGAGGMGEVYRAKDTRLDRIVAIKVLPSHLSSDPDLRQRFEREARAISSLNHPERRIADGSSDFWRRS